jgi:hypothetical protein
VVSEPSSCQPVKKHLTHDPMILGKGKEYPKGRGYIGGEYIQYHRGYIRDRREINMRDYIPFHIHLDTEPETEDRDRYHISSEIEAQIEGKMGDKHDIPEGKGKGPEAPYENNQAMLNDLARGKQDMIKSITQMEIRTQLIQNSMGTIGANVEGGARSSIGHHGGGASGSSGNPIGSSGHQTPNHTYTSAGKIPKMLFP